MFMYCDRKFIAAEFYNDFLDKLNVFKIWTFKNLVTVCLNSHDDVYITTSHQKQDEWRLYMQHMQHMSLRVQMLICLSVFLF